MEYKGKVVKIMDETIVSEKFKKREFVVSDGHDQYPQTVIFEFHQDRTKELDAVKEGDDVNVFFNLRGREWKNPSGEIKYFNTLNAFKVNVLGQSENKPQQPAPRKNSNSTHPPASVAPSDDDSLPF